MKYKLVWSENDQFNTHVLEGKDVVTLGRSNTADIRVTDRTISRQHAQIIKRGDTYILTVLSKTNPIWINGQTPLRQGEETYLDKVASFRMGNVTLRVVDAERREPQVSCSGCGKAVSMNLTDCPWCGTSLAMAATIYKDDRS
jgi:predicted component of type VI protein secretion system